MASARHYTIRNVEGTMIAKIVGSAANIVLRNAEGFWREYKTDKKKTRCFEIENSGVYYIGDVCIYLWVGYLIIED